MRDLDFSSWCRKDVFLPIQRRVYSELSRNSLSQKEAGPNFSLCPRYPGNRLNTLLTYMNHIRWTKKLALLSSVAYYKARSSRCLTKAFVEERGRLAEKAPIDRRYHDDRQDSRP